MVGPNKEEYSLHEAAISCLSKPLHVLLNGDMKEAKEKHVHWPDINEKTFVRFIQWAYTGDYVAQEPEIVEFRPYAQAPVSSQEGVSTSCNEVPE